MESINHPDRLQKQLIHLKTLEAAIQRRLEELMPEVSDHAQATALLADFHTLSRDQHQALETRLNKLPDNGPPSSEPSAVPAAVSPSDGTEYPVSSSLQEIYTLYNQAVIGYAALGSISTRSLDSWLVADEGTSAHLASQHIENYVGAIQEISRLINDVVLWELDRDGHECQCICPSCGVGVCLCSVAWKNIVSSAWSEAGSIANYEGIPVQHPKQDSTAAIAGLVRGDVILAVEGEKIESLGDMQSAVRNGQPGEEVQLTVRRRSNELEEVAINI